MDSLQKEIGKRLKEIRKIYLDGTSVSARQLAENIGETKDNIANYENGKANVPNRVMIALYNKGFNPVYILTGENSMFADNTAGKALNAIIKEKNKSNVKRILKISDEQDKIIEFVEKQKPLKAAAGNMIKNKKGTNIRK
ncbi:MAG: hypothetical protein WCT77_01260 [Bacteroidota bacterium]